MAEITLAANGARRLLLFTGDIGRVRNSTIAPGKVVHSGPTEGESPDVLVMESTYGNRHHPHEDVMPETGRADQRHRQARRQHRRSRLCRRAHPEVPLPAQGTDGAEPDSAHPRLCRLAHGNPRRTDLPQAQRGVQRRDQGADCALRLAAQVAGLPLCQHRRRSPRRSTRATSRRSSSPPTECARAAASSTT